MLVRPNLIIKDITKLNLEALKAQGIKGLIFDLDNTIMAPHACKLEDEMVNWLHKLRAEDFKMLVLSNNKQADYCEKVGQLLKEYDIPIIGQASKPRRRKFRQALEMLGLTPKEVAMVGDRPLTDVWVGNRAGAYTILVDPLTKSQERIYIKFLRWVEGLFVKGTERLHVRFLRWLRGLFASKNQDLGESMARREQNR